MLVSLKRTPEPLYPLLPPLSITPLPSPPTSHQIIIITEHRHTKGTPSVISMIPLTKNGDQLLPLMYS